MARRNVYLPADLDAYAREQGLSLSAVLQEALLAHRDGRTLGAGWEEGDAVMRKALMRKALMRPVVSWEEGWEAPVIGAGDFGVTESVRALRKSRGL